jgi:intein/homing endonuclease
MRRFEFDCGCSFPMTGDKIKLDIEKVPLNCKRTWDLISSGLTKGVFQLESGLGKHWTKKLKPENMEHLSALGAILRPGVLRAVDENDISMTEHYCRRKNGEEPVEYFHPALKPILKTSYGVLIYQEQAMAIAKDIAGFNLQEADELRKCITGDSLFISKNRGYITLRDMIRKGYKNDYFLTMTETGQQDWKQIEKVWWTKICSVLEITTKTGLKIKATPNHKIMTNRSWQSAENITLDDYIICSRQSDFVGKDVIKDELAIVVAGILCEGYHKTNNITFVSHNTEMMNLFVNSFCSIFPNIYINITNNKVARIRRGALSILRKYIPKIKSAGKVLPEELLCSSKEQCRKFLSYMLACEGGVSQNGQFEFSSKSKVLILQVRNLLRRFNIVSRLKTKIVEKYGKFYRLYINDITQQITLLRELTTLWPQEKINALTKIIKSKSIYCYSDDKLPKNMCKHFILDGGKPKEGSINFLKRCVTISKLKRIAHNEYWNKLANGNQYYDKVIKIRILKPKRVYDFTMSDSSMPYAIVNDMIVSNSIGKKLPAEMEKVKHKFIAGIARLKIVSEKEGQAIFGWIKESQRYSFNKSHSMCYAMNGYRSAYCKAHFPMQMYTSWLFHAHEKQKPKKEICELINEAKILDINVLPPDITNLQPNFYTNKKVITFGLKDIKGIGDSVFKKLITSLQGKDFNSWSWLRFLCEVGPIKQENNRLGQSVLAAMVSVGAFRHYGNNRTLMLKELDTWTQLSRGEALFIAEKVDSFSNLTDALKSVAKLKKDGGGCHGADRKQVVESLLSMLENPPSKLEDSPNWIAGTEEMLLGAALTCSRIDGCDISSINATCKDFISGKTNNLGSIILGVEIQSMQEIKTRKGKNPGQKMCRLTISDGTCAIDTVCFPDSYKEYGHLLTEGNTVIIQGQKDRRQGSFIVNKVWQAELINLED